MRRRYRLGRRRARVTRQPSDECQWELSSCSIQCAWAPGHASGQVMPATATKGAATMRPVAWTFLPFIERKCQNGRFGQILRRTPSRRRDEMCTNSYADTVIANDLWRGLASAVRPPANLFGVAIGGRDGH